MQPAARALGRAAFLHLCEHKNQMPPVCLKKPFFSPLFSNKGVSGRIKLPQPPANSFTHSAKFPALWGTILLLLLSNK